MSDNLEWFGSLRVRPRVLAHERPRHALQRRLTERAKRARDAPQDPQPPHGQSREYGVLQHGLGPNKGTISVSTASHTCEHVDELGRSTGVRSCI